MKVLLVAIAALICSAGAEAQQSESAPRAGPALRLLQAFYRAPADPHAGRLNELTARLMMLERHMPKAVVLATGGTGPAQDGSQGDGQTDQVEPVVPIEPPEQENWVRVVDKPVVGEDKLAMMLYRGGSYDEAARIYRRMLAVDPKGRHCLFMLVLCECNAGNVQRARELLKGLPAQSPEHLWAQWALDMAELREPMVARPEGTVSEPGGRDADKQSPTEDAHPSEPEEVKP